ncbi:DUF1456 family protein [Colwellia sp. 12G3]|uniref:DUF1456 family protein n=1 Tax=Colwellia sp. 12G3 TaxID=2058299 RepID=UPI000C3406C6|nr:DUF1456 family protein [Colwellia sp. 12G3]PKI14818.1 DUF1456 domain-containing protein [Colwellia sp. 12G3]
MINNDILRRIRTIFDLTDEKIITTFALSQCEISADQLANFFKEKDDSEYQAIEDVQFSSFLNGLITAQRGPSEGPERENEQELTNNMIFNKVKIALSLKAEEVISILELAELSLDKHELSALFRNVSNKHYKNCSDEVLSAFLKGLKIKAQ